MTTPAPRISLVIPAYNEEELLPRLLRTVEDARQHYARERDVAPDAVEVIVADNASTDATASIAREHGARVPHVETRSIAASRNGGAAIARGEILCFVDADFRIHPETFVAVEDALESGRYVAGASRVRPERWSLGLLATFAVYVPLLLLSGLDTGVVFCRREDFDAVGGYDERRRFAEDVQFLWDLKRLGKKRGQKLVRLRGVKAITSNRKFDRYGHWHYFTRMPGLALQMFREPSALDDFAREYWYEGRGGEPERLDNDTTTRS